MLSEPDDVLEKPPTRIKVHRTAILASPQTPDNGEKVPQLRTPKQYFCTFACYKAMKFPACGRSASQAPHRRLWQKGTRSSATTLAVGTFLAYGSVFDAARASLKAAATSPWRNLSQ
jgi:hypothetical protein